MIAAVVAIFRALAAYWQLKAVRYQHDLIEQSRDRIERLEDEIEEHRNTGTIASTDMADRVRERLRCEKKHFEYLSNADPATGDRDKGRD